MQANLLGMVKGMDESDESIDVEDKKLRLYLDKYIAERTSAVAKELDDE